MAVEIQQEHTLYIYGSAGRPEGGQGHLLGSSDTAGTQTLALGQCQGHQIIPNLAHVQCHGGQGHQHGSIYTAGEHNLDLNQCQGSQGHLHGSRDTSETHIYI